MSTVFRIYNPENGEWEAILIGERGLQGWQGQEGAGFQGPQGWQGQTGTIGVDGVQGAQGWQGQEGAGFQGPQGWQGERGLTGATGAAGADGADGILPLSGSTINGIITYDGDGTGTVESNLLFDSNENKLTLRGPLELRDSNGNIKIGLAAAECTTNGSNIAIGNNALVCNTVTGLNFAIGNLALCSYCENNITAGRNFAIGHSSMSNLENGCYNTAIGDSAGFNIDGGDDLTTANASLFIGPNTRSGANDSCNEIVIGNLAVGLGTNSVVLGNDSITTTALKGCVGIGITSPSAELHVNGNIIATDIDAKASCVNNTNDNTCLKFWSGTQSQYDALTPDADTIYFII